MGDFVQKAFLGIIALGVCCIIIKLVPISKKASYWNRCLDSTVKWINEKSEIKTWDKAAQESIAVGVCNGAVHEPKLKRY